MSANYFFGVRSDMPSLKVSWHQGLNKPPILQKGKIPSWENGVLFVGDEGMLLADADKYILLPEENFRGFKPPQLSIPGPKSHFAEWIEACKEGKPTGCNFDYASTLTEIIQLANVAYRVGKMLQWDPVNFLRSQTYHLLNGLNWRAVKFRVSGCNRRSVAVVRQKGWMAAAFSSYDRRTGHVAGSI
jgi:hypothetical protein